MSGIFGAPQRRLEDARLLRGEALFVDDLQLPGMLHLAFVRSPHAHARLRAIDTAAAAAAPGVVGVYTAESMGEHYQCGPLMVPPPPIEAMVFNERTQWPLARGKVRYAGEPVAVVAAHSRYLAEDVAEAVRVEYEPLPPVVDFETALAEDSPRVHDDLPDNLAARVRQSKGDYAAHRHEAALVVADEFHYERPAAAAIENRGIVARFDPRADKLDIWATTQAPIPLRALMAGYLGLPEATVDVVAPFIGGGFGPKIMVMYSEEMVAGWLALMLGHPVKWIEDRRENFVATTQERGQVHRAEMALRADGTIIGVHDEFVHDSGAYCPYGLTVPLNSQCTLPGPYRVPHYTSRFDAVFTNKTIVTPVRGAGRQHGVFVMERLLDRAARELGLDALEIRRRNMLRPDEFPYDNEIIYQDFAPLTYDSGDYLPAWEQALETVAHAHFREREQPEARAAGRRLGIGVAPYVEGSGIGPYEGARVTVGPSGDVTVTTGVGTQGQSHFTVFAQIVAEQLGVALDRIRVVTGDTRAFHWGTGTFASRGAVVAGNACHAAALAVRDKILGMAAGHWGVDPEAIELADGFARRRDEPGQRLALGELAKAANPLRGAVAPDAEPGLEATRYFGPRRGTTASGVHAAVVEVDPDTLRVSVLRYVVVHDCGRVINPLVLDGQIHGGVAMGLGQALSETLRYDADGILTNTSLQDYLLPTALDVPRIRTGHQETIAPGNPLGVKGAGEGGAIAVAPVIAQAVDDALADTGLFLRRMPLTPSCLHAALHEAAQL